MLEGRQVPRNTLRLVMRVHRTSEAKFSESFLKVEHAADDSSLVEVLSSDAAALRGRFNADVTKTRLVMLLSPT